MPADWQIRFWPACTRYAFLSHCREDRERLVLPIDAALKQRNCRTWIDRQDYPSGRDAFEVLRDKILECRHIIYFVTSSYLKQGRGWTGVERAIGSIVQHNLRHGSSEIGHVELPLFFVPEDHDPLRCSAWGGTVGSGRGLFYPPGRTDAGAAGWAVKAILHFIWQEQQYALEVADRTTRDANLNNRLLTEQNLHDRILAISPPPLPITPI